MKLSAEEAGAIIGESAARTMYFDRSPGTVVATAVDQLKKLYRKLLATLPSEEQWATAVASWVRLNVPTNHAAAVVSDVFTAAFYLETALLTLVENGTLRPVITTSESTEDFEKLRKSVAAYRRVLFNEQAEAAPVPAAAVELEPAQPSEDDLDEQIVRDWQTLCTSDVRSKWRMPDYKARFDRLMATGRLGR
jgi:hypothetical protein